MLARVLTIGLVLAFIACEKTDHETIDKWTRTEKGPGKLAKALADESIDPDLSAHAAANLIKPPLAQEAEVREALERMSPGRRTLVIGKLAPRLWDMARIENPMKLPNAPHVAAKDALFAIRKLADDAQRTQIDGYLIDWYAVASYEARSQPGQYSGAVVVRTVGPAFTKKLIEVINAIITAPAEGKARLRVGDELMIALAATGSPEAVKKLLDVSRMDLGDDKLASRVLVALYRAYVDPASLFDIQAPDALVPNLDTIVAIARDDTRPGDVANNAVQLIRAIGPPKCFDALLGMIASPHRQPVFKYVTATAALLCGGTKTITQVVRAMPDSGAYAQDELAGTVVHEISRMSPRDQVLGALRELLGDKGTITRWVAIEALTAMKSVEDQPRILALSGAKDRLIGYWGRAVEGKTDPTLGQRAKELADKFSTVGGGK